MNSNLIQKELMKWVMANTSDIVVPNYYLGRWECDVMKVSKAGQIYEYEIKVSRADFKKDAQKKGEHYNWEKRDFDAAKTKHQDILDGKRCSRFYFVVPENMIKPEEVPDGLGLIYASKGHREGSINFKIVKVSKHFKKDPVKIDFYRHISQNLTLKLIDAKSRLFRLKK